MGGRRRRRGSARRWRRTGGLWRGWSCRRVLKPTRRIGAELGRLVQGMEPPGTLIVAGGETLRGLCIALGARSLEVRGRIVPGLPHSVLRGGVWDGVLVVSKSGAFGHPGLLRDLILE